MIYCPRVPTLLPSLACCINLEKDNFSVSETGVSEEKIRLGSRSRTYEHLVTSPDALPLSYRRLVGVKASKLYLLPYRKVGTYPDIGDNHRKNKFFLSDTALGLLTSIVEAMLVIVIVNPHFISQAGFFKLRAKKMQQRRQSSYFRGR